MLDEPPEPTEPVMTQAKVLIEHNSTDEDTGFQAFADGDPWSELTITGPDDVVIGTFNPRGSLADFGLTELFYETSEPENAEVPIADVLMRLPEGTYTFTGTMIDLEGNDVNIVGYQVIVEEPATESMYPQGFAWQVYSIYLPADATETTIPAEFMRSGSDYKYEVLAIEESGNQTLSSAAFTTQ
jgi:hypothetical protein